MKNATKHADALKALHKRLSKEHAAGDKPVIDPIRALVQGTLMFDAPDGRLNEAMAAIDREFVDLNELRVGTELELAHILGLKHPQIEHRVTMLREMLNFIFEKEHTLSLERLKTVGRKEVRGFLKELPDINGFVEAYTALYAFDVPAVPVDEAALAFLKESDVVEAETSVDEAQKFVEAHTRADDCHEMFALLRKASTEKKKAK